MASDLPAAMTPDAPKPQTTRKKREVVLYEKCVCGALWCKSQPPTRGKKCSAQAGKGHVRQCANNARYGGLCTTHLRYRDGGGWPALVTREDYYRDALQRIASFPILSRGGIDVAMREIATDALLRYKTDPQGGLLK